MKNASDGGLTAVDGVTSHRPSARTAAYRRARARRPRAGVAQHPGTAVGRNGSASFVRCPGWLCWNRSGKQRDPASSGRRGSASRYHRDLTDGGGAGGTRTPDPLHAMQVLSQLSYNPTVGPLVGAISVAIRPALTGCSTGEFRARRRRLPPIPARCGRGRRVLLPRQRIGPEDITGVCAASIGAIGAPQTTGAVDRRCRTLAPPRFLRS